jgi:hypothetical protein
MKPEPDIPAFASESDEAAWWPSQEDTLGALMEQAAKQGAPQKVPLPAN